VAIEAAVDQKEPESADRPFAGLRATAEERARILSAASPFDVESWQRGAVPPTPEELDDLEEFLQEREELAAGRQAAAASGSRGRICSNCGRNRSSASSSS